jgi:hypothetical protein
VVLTWFLRGSFESVQTREMAAPKGGRMRPSRCGCTGSNDQLFWDVYRVPVQMAGYFVTRKLLQACTLAYYDYTMGLVNCQALVTVSDCK